MIVLGKDILGKTIVHVDNDEEKAKVKDLLFDRNELSITYLTYEIDKPTDETKTLQEEQRVLDSIAAGGPRNTSQWNATPGIRLGANQMFDSEKQTFFIPAAQIDRMTEKAVTMKGSEKESPAERDDSLSCLFLLDLPVEDEEGEKIGKIKDLVVEEKEKRVIGLKLSEGFWEKIIGDGSKYLSIEGIELWLDEKVIVKTAEKENLQDDMTALLK
ncbi:MAG TPA: PRC-barrel domain-containing protein [Bacillales bacterium]|nr:PRC-barrel domain-containing protein [Bacillales bacterium]